MSIRQLFNKIAQFLVPHRFTYLSLMLIMIMTAIATAVGPLITKWVIDTASNAPNDFNYRLILLSITIFYIIVSILSYIEKRIQNFISFTIAYDIRLALFRKIINFRSRFHSQHNIGDLISRTQSDVDLLEQGLAGSLIMFVVDALRSLLLFSILFSLDSTLALTVMPVLPLFFVAQLIFFRRISNEGMSARQKTSETFSALEESISSIRAIQGLGVEEAVGNNYRSKATAWLKQMIKTSSWSVSANSIFNLLAGISTTLVLVVGAQRMATDQMTMGDLVAFLISVGGLYAPILRVSETGLIFAQVKSAAERIVEILDEPNDIQIDKSAIPVVLEGKVDFIDVSFSYGTKKVLNNISFNINPGESLLVLGESGVGKSTIASLLARLWDGLSGEILLDNHRINSIDSESLRSGITLLTQESFILYGSVRENLKLVAPTATDDQFMVSLKIVGLDKWLAQLPDGLETQVGNRGLRLSGGQRQRLALARVLLKPGQILILDEATSAIDIAGEMNLWQSMLPLLQERTLINISHRLSSAQMVDKILILETNGKIAGYGPHDKLLAGCQLYQNLWSEWKDHVNKQQTISIVNEETPTHYSVLTQSKGRS